MSKKNYPNDVVEAKRNATFYKSYHGGKHFWQTLKSIAQHLKDLRLVERHFGREYKPPVNRS